MSTRDLVLHIDEPPQSVPKSTPRAPKKTDGPLTGRGGSFGSSAKKKKRPAQKENSEVGAAALNDGSLPQEPAPSIKLEKDITPRKKLKPFAPKVTMIVGIDNGMSGSGMSSALENTDPAHVTAETTWPKAEGIAVKVPSEVALYEDNVGHEDFESPSINYFGFENPEDAVVIGYYKISMDSDARVSIFDDPILENAVSSKLLRREDANKNKRAMVTAMRRLRQIHHDRISSDLGLENLNSIGLIYVLSYPAACSPRGIEALSDAAKDAGFGDRPFDKIEFISEAHAAVMAAFAGCTVKYGPQVWDTLFKPGNLVTILDLGALTNDLATVRIISNDPKLQLKEVTIGTGGKCGTAAIHCRILQILEQKYGTAFTELPDEQVQRGSQFFSECEKILKRFDGKRLNKVYRLPLALRLNAPHDDYNGETGEVLLEGYEFKHAIDGSLKYAKDLLLEQRDQVRALTHLSTGAKILLTVVLCGGGSLIPYIFETLKRFCEEHEVEVTRARDPESTVSRGAVISQLNQNFLGLRKSRASYGIIVHSQGEEYLQWWLSKAADVDTTREVELKKLPGLVYMSASEIINHAQSFTFGIYMYAGSGPNPRKPTDPGVERISSIVIAPSSMSNYLRKKLSQQMKEEGTTMTHMPVTISLAIDRSGRLVFEAKTGQCSLGKGFLRYDATEKDPER